MTNTFERLTSSELPERRPPSLRALRADFGGQYVGAGATGVLFSATESSTNLAENSIPYSQR